MRIIIECPERILHLEAGYIYADCTFAQLQTSCSSVADHTLRVIEILQQQRRLGPLSRQPKRIESNMLEKRRTDPQRV